MRPLLGILATCALFAGACAGTTAEQVESDKGAPAEGAAARSSTTATTLPPDCAAMLPASGQASQLLMVSTNDPLNAAEVVKAGTVGGFVLNEGQRTDVGQRITEAVTDAPLPVSVAVDEEGGSVQRLRNAIGKLSSAEDMSEGTPQEAAELFREHAMAMSEIGVNMNCARGAEVGAGGGLDDRVYGDDATTVGTFVTAIIAAQTEAGIIPVVKHWPGIGSGDDDPHDSLTKVPSIDELRAADLLPFERAIEEGVPVVMVTHAEVPGLTGEDEPASLSSNAIDGELRGREGFEGVVITDDLSMSAIELPQEEAAEAAIRAGADIAMVSGADSATEAHDRLTAAIQDGTLDEARVEQAVRRVLRMKGVDGECFDAVSFFAEADRLENEQLTEGSVTEGSNTEGSNTEGSNTEESNTEESVPRSTGT